MNEETERPVGDVASLGLAHTLAIATLIEILVRDGFINVDEVTRAYSTLATKLRKTVGISPVGPHSLDKIVHLVRTSRGAIEGTA